ncbi:MAG: hypothetical protein J7K66_01225 [Anaerolineaceae bacterium]|nr:hypothetical protein [Anaerolineaceae bacterium]
MKTDMHKRAFKQAFLAFSISAIFFLIICFSVPACAGSPICDTLSIGQDQSALTKIELPSTYDSRVFLLPLQPFLHIFLNFIPFFQNGNLAAIFLTLFFVSCVSGLISLAARYTGIRSIFAWLLITVYLTNWNTLYAVITGSGVFILVFFLLLVFVYLAQWYRDKYWLALVWIGLGMALAVVAQFTSIFFLLLPVFIALFIAFKEKPNNVDYAENALWIMLTPLLYVLVVRLLFGYVMGSDPFAFLRIESGITQSLTYKQTIISSFLPRLALLIPDFFSTMWITYAPFVLVSAFAVLISLLKKKVLPISFILIIWAPLLTLHLVKQIGLYDYASIVAALSVASTPIIAIISALPLKKYRTLYLIITVLQLVIWNGLDWITLFNVMS